MIMIYFNYGHFASWILQWILYFIIFGFHTFSYFWLCFIIQHLRLKNISLTKLLIQDLILVASCFLIRLITNHITELVRSNSLLRMTKFCSKHFRRCVNESFYQHDFPRIQKAFLSQKSSFDEELSIDGARSFSNGTEHKATVNKKNEDVISTG